MKAKNPSNYWHCAAVSLLVLWASNATAFETFNGGCVTCHPFDGPSTGFPDEFTVHELHNLITSSNCFLCHASVPDNPDIGIKDPNVDRGCVGCHGRFEDLGSDSGSFADSDGLGAGLTQHHTNAGVGQCAGCHSNANPANYTPVGEDVLPLFYVEGLSDINDPCFDYLDNDGDLLRDVEEDPDCGGGSEAPISDPNGPYTGVTGVAVQFDGSGSSDPDGTIVAYDWDFGDGDTDTGASPSHMYAAAGNYTVTLTVTDDDGLTDTATTSAAIEDMVANEPPVADAGGPYSGSPGQNVQFDGSGSSDPDGTIVAYDWDFGDGDTGTGASPSHTYAAAGNYTVMLTVTDDGGLTDTATTSAAIEDMTGNQPPVADAGGPYTGSPGQEVQFDGSGSFDPDGTIFAYFWEFGDGSLGAVGEAPTHIYDAPGTYTVTLTVGDNDGDLTSDTTTVEITDDTTPPPTGDGWVLRVPSNTSPGEIEFQIEIEDFGGILWFDEEYADGQLAFGIGQESGDFFFWMDSLGALFYGTVDHSDGTMMGIVFDFRGDRNHDTIFFGEQL